MRYVPASLIAAAVALGASAALIAQGAAPAKGAPAPQGETNRLVAGGGISAPGWMGKLIEFRSELERHIREEENEIFPRLKTKLDAAENKLLTIAVTKEGFKLA